MNQLKFATAISEDDRDAKAVSRSSNEDLFTNRPDIDRDFIRSVATLPNAEDLVRDRHDHLISDRSRGIRLQINRNEEIAYSGRERSLKSLESTDLAIENTSVYYDAVGETGQEGVPPSLPWNAFEKIEFGFYAVLMIALLCVGAVTIANLLINSGIFPAFIESPWMAYLVTLIPIALSVIPKFAYESLESERSRRIFKRSLFGAAAFSGIIWLVCSAVVYSPNSSSDSDLIAQIVAGEQSSSRTSLVPVTIFQVITELLIASLLFIHLKQLWDKHTRLHRIPNSHYKQLRDSRIELEREHSHYGTLLKQVEFDRQRLADLIGDYLNEALTFLKLVQRTL
jgi:hypothetical protein